MASAAPSVGRTRLAFDGPRVIALLGERQGSSLNQNDMTSLSLRAASALSLCVALLTVGSAGCGPARSANEIQIDKLPEYTGAAAKLFNDSIEPSALGLSLEKVTFKNDAHFRERVQQADVVSEVEITTVTVGKTDEKSVYFLQFEPQQGYTKLGLASDMLELRVADGEGAYPLINMIQARARGRKLIGMWKRFREGNAATLHWYFAPDNEDTVSATKEALTLRELTEK